MNTCISGRPEVYTCISGRPELNTCISGRPELNTCISGRPELIFDLLRSFPSLYFCRWLE